MGFYEAVVSTIADYLDNGVDDWDRDDGLVHITGRSDHGITLSLFATDNNGEITKNELEHVAIRCIPSINFMVPVQLSGVWLGATNKHRRRPMQIISERQRHHEELYHQTYVIRGTGCGYSFDCDENGVVDVEHMNPDAKVNYKYCQAGINERGETIKPNGVRKSEHNWVEEAIGKCDDCGGEVELSGFTNTCENCGADYDHSGQQLAPREQWGEETGEHPADIARIP